jgi:hypothetical protein
MKILKKNKNTNEELLQNKRTKRTDEKTIAKNLE